MSESIDLATIRGEAFLRAVVRAREVDPEAGLTVSALAAALGLHPTELGYVIRPLVAEGVVIIHGEPSNESVALTGNGLTEANNLMRRRLPAREATRILFVDSEPETVQRVKDAGYSVSEASMGYRTGKRAFQHPPPNEVDLIVCDLKRPVCFDKEWWGPGKNNNQRCKLIPYEEVSNKYFKANNRRYAQHQLIQESQLGDQIPGTFGAKDVNTAIAKGGVPFLILLNKEWLQRSSEFPNWADVSWSFEWTSAAQVDIGEPLLSLLPELGSDLKFRLMIQHRITSGPVISKFNPHRNATTTEIVTNNVGHVFGQLVRFGKGSIWLVPGTHQNADLVELFSARLDAVRLPKPTAQDISSIWKDLHNVLMSTGQQAPKQNPSVREEPMPANRIRVFISHSSSDVEVAEKLIDLLRSAIPSLQPETIRCTSVPGYKLPGGADTDQEVFEELLGADVLLALLSKKSIGSTYVLFELGARWGAKLHFFPIVISGMEISELKAPLNSRNAHSAGIETDLHQLLYEIAEKLGFAVAKPYVYAHHLRSLVEASVDSAAIKAIVLTPPLAGDPGPSPLGTGGMVASARKI